MNIDFAFIKIRFHIDKDAKSINYYALQDVLKESCILEYLDFQHGNYVFQL